VDRLNLIQEDTNTIDEFDTDIILKIVDLKSVELSTILIKFYICIRGRVVEGTGLIIRFPMEHHWFEPSRMHV
jgi:hypothetical protein